MPGPLWVYILIAAVLMVGGILILGLPGAVYAVAAEPVVRLIRGLPPDVLLAGDNAWPKAIMLTLLVPPIIPALRLAQTVLWPDAGLWPHLAMLVFGFYLWSVIVFFVMSF